MSNAETILATLEHRIREADSPVMLTATLPLFRLKGEPYTLNDHFFFKPLFDIKLPRRCLFKCARQVGKCIAESDIGKIRCANGAPLRKDLLVPGTYVLSMDNNYRIVPKRITQVWDKGVQKLLRIHTRTGSVISVTPEHRLRGPNGYIQTKDIRKGTRLALAAYGGTFAETSPVCKNRIQATGYMLGAGGCADKHQPELSIGKEAYPALFKGFIAEQPTDTYSVYTTKKGSKRVYWKKLSPIRKWLEKDNLVGKYPWQKEMPPWAYDLTYEDTKLLIESLWATDGTLTYQRNGSEVAYTTTSGPLASALRSLLAKIGIFSTKKPKKTSCRGARKRPAYVVRVEGAESRHKFMKTLSVPGKPSLSLHGDYGQSNRDTIPRAPTASTLENLLEGDVKWDCVTETTEVSSERTFDIEVEDTHNFVLDGIISHNSQNMSVAKLSRTVSIPYYNSLFVCPRFEQIKRISNNYMRPLIETSPVKKIFLRDGPGRDQNVLQRTFANGSIHFYSFAFLDAERIRSISCSDVNIDEVQDIQWDFIPVIAETMSGSKRFRNQLYTGTPKTVDNTIQQLWQDSSQAEWVIKCEACNHWNVPSISHDLLAMIGKEGPICSKCGRGIEPRTGGWAHSVPDRQNRFVGYHIPQSIHPLHYESRENWLDLLYKMHTYDEYRFINECLGESFDSGIKLMTLKQLRELACLHPNTLQDALLQRRSYELISMGIDWGGGGHESQSFTSVVLAGLRPGSDVVDVLYYEKLHRAMAPEEETVWLLDLIKRFNPHFVAHDYGGAGNLRELLMLQAGVPLKKIVPYTYVCSSKKPVITFDPDPGGGSRSSYSIDKARSLVTLCTMMKAGKIRLPLREEQDETDPMNDLLNLNEDRQERPRGSDVVIITKTAGTSDDTAHALNYACSSLWYASRGYPDLAEAMRIKLSQADAGRIAPQRIKLSDWRRPDDR